MTYYIHCRKNHTPHDVWADVHSEYSGKNRRRKKRLALILVGGMMTMTVWYE
jgi:hypothetical protein